MNKSNTFVILLLMCISLNASAQSYLGVYGGINRSRLSGDSPDKASYKSILGANAGAYFDLKLGKGIWLSLQPSFSQEGSKVSYKVYGKSKPVDSLKIRLDYFSLPVFLKISSTNERFYALAGIECAMLLSSTLSSNGTELDNDLKVADWNIAMHFGAGIHIPIGWPRLYVELRYSQGLVNLTDEPLNESYIPRVKTSGFKLLTGIEIPIGKPQN